MREYRKIEVVYTVKENIAISSKTMRMVLEGDTSEISCAGQFINLEITGKYLRRPISISDYDEGSVTILYDVVGEGTRAMSQMPVGTKINVLTGLGNGFSENYDCAHPLLIGGGIGSAPLYNLAKKLCKQGKEVTVVLGYNKHDDVVLESEFQALGARTIICTADGSYGERGFVTDAINNLNLEGDYFYACGPTPMLRALCSALTIPGELSLESRMGCGFGACMCCSIETKDSSKRICKDGPVFNKEELVWK